MASETVSEEDLNRYMSLLQRLAPIIERLHRDKKIVFKDGGQVDLIIDDDRKALLAALATIVRAMAAEKYRPTTSGLQHRIHDLDGIFNLPDIDSDDDPTKLAFLLTRSLNHYELLRLVAETDGQRKAALTDFLEKRCSYIYRFVDSLIPLPMPRYFEVFYPQISHLRQQRRLAEQPQAV